MTEASTIPPNAGIAMGIMMSAPRPVDVSTGSRAIIVVAEVMTAGFILLRPAYATAFLIS